MKKMRITGKMENIKEEVKTTDLKREQLETATLFWFSENNIGRVSYLRKHNPRDGKIMSISTKSPLDSGLTYYMKINGESKKWLEKIDNSRSTFDFFCHTNPPIFVEVKSRDSQLNKNQEDVANSLPFPLIVVEPTEKGIGVRRVILDNSIDFSFDNIGARERAFSDEINWRNQHGEVRCLNCGYEWETLSSAETVSCPKCSEIFHKKEAMTEKSSPIRDEKMSVNTEKEEVI